ncbi:MAG TPA: aspartate aminotransferase family protein, partial [Desulfobacterales bacterium]|nr:aspartate aminotransferase family protein [Desulfobacterales bacterium]
YPELKKICKKNGSLLIIDEVQTGLGRTGKMWGIEQYDVVPDIMVTAKGLSGGIYPITATIIRKELESVFHQDPFIHISTAGGGEVGCAVAQKVLDITSSDSFLNHVNDLAEIFKSGVGKLKLKYPELLAEFRQSGMMMGIKTTHSDLGALMTKTCYDAGLLCILSGNDTSVMQFLPALNISKDLAYEILERLDKAFELTKKYVDEYLSKGDS